MKSLTQPFSLVEPNMALPMVPSVEPTLVTAEAADVAPLVTPRNMVPIVELKPDACVCSFDIRLLNWVKALLRAFIPAVNLEVSTSTRVPAPMAGVV